MTQIPNVLFSSPFRALARDDIPDTTNFFCLSKVIGSAYLTNVWLWKSSNNMGTTLTLVNGLSDVISKQNSF